MIKIYFYKTHLEEFNKISSTFQKPSNIVISSTHYSLNLIKVELKTDCKIRENSIKKFIKFLNNHASFRIIY